jgi:hypothetical protein
VIRQHLRVFKFLEDLNFILKIMLDEFRNGSSMKLMALMLKEISRESVRGSMEKYFESDSIDLFLQDFQEKLNVFRIIFSGYTKTTIGCPGFPEDFRRRARAGLESSMGGSLAARGHPRRTNFEFEKWT